MKNRGFMKRCRNKAKKPKSLSKRCVGSKETEIHIRHVDDVGYTDEVGSPYSKIDPPLRERFFGQSVTMEEESGTLARIMKKRRERALDDPMVSGYNKYRIENGWELKSKEDSESGRQEVYSELDKANLWRAGYFIDHRRPPRGWSNNGSKNRKMMLEYTVDKVLEERDGDIFFVVDHCDDYGDDYVRQMLRKRRTPDRDVDGDSFDSEESDFALELQAQDYSNRQMLDVLRDLAKDDQIDRALPRTINKPYRIRRVDSLERYSKSKRHTSEKQKKVR